MSEYAVTNGTETIMDRAANPPEHHMITKAAEFSNRYITQGAADWERQKGLPPEGIRPAAEAGLCGMLLAEDLGGKGLTKTAMPGDGGTVQGGHGLCLCHDRP